MTREEIFEEIVTILKDVLGTQASISRETLLEKDLAIDSLRAMEILAAVEDRFDITIPINILNEVRTVEDLVIQVEKLLSEG